MLFRSDEAKGILSDELKKTNDEIAAKHTEDAMLAEASAAHEQIDDDIKNAPNEVVKTILEQKKLELPQLDELTNDSKNEQGLPSKVGERQEPVETESDESTSAQAAGDSGVVQSPQEQVVHPEAIETEKAVLAEAEKQGIKLDEDELSAAVEIIHDNKEETPESAVKAVVESREGTKERMEEIKNTKEEELSEPTKPKTTKQKVVDAAKKFFGVATQEEIDARAKQLEDLGVSKEDAHLAPHLLARLHKGLQALGVKADVFRSVKFGKGKAEKGSLKQEIDEIKDALQRSGHDLNKVTKHIKHFTKQKHKTNRI